jgi:hypothetical protein
MEKNYIKKIENYIGMLCSVKPNRRTGSIGNHLATDFIATALSTRKWESILPLSK